MSANSLIMLGLCSFTLTLLIQYAIWTRLRVIRLRNDLRRFAAELHTAALSAGRTGDRAFLDEMRSMEAHIALADGYSVAAASYLLWAVHKYPELFGAQAVRSDSPSFQTILDRSHNRLVRRIADYMTHETLGGWLAAGVLRFLPRSSRRDIRREAAESFRPTNLVCVS